MLLEVLALIVEGPDLHSMREWMGLSKKPSNMKFLPALQLCHRPNL